MDQLERIIFKINPVCNGMQGSFLVVLVSKSGSIVFPYKY